MFAIKNNAILSILLVLGSLFLVAPYELKTCGINAIYQLGDSISDTGNLAREQPQAVIARLPYGKTINKATGRSSDGLLMIDYFATSAGLPFLQPYLDPNAPKDHGINFAVAGCTALPWQILAKRNIFCPITNSSLTTQLRWMDTYFHGMCNNGDCAQKLAHSLFMVGEIGGNDYNYALLQRKTFEEVKAMVPDVVQAIKDAVTRVISFGATRVVVPGNFPIGCLPIYLTGLRTNVSTAYDELHCLKDLNDLSLYHNTYLKQAIEQLKNEHPDVAIAYGDYYNALLSLVRDASKLGFEVGSVQKACCGIGGDYNFNAIKVCGYPNVPVCKDPNKYINWDGVHLTQKAYQLILVWLINNIFPNLKC